MFTNTSQFMSRIALPLALLLSFALAFADDPVPASLSGTVTAAGSGQPLEGITVAIGDINQHFLSPPAAETTTDSAGEWTVEVDFFIDPERVIVVEAAGPEHAPGRHGAVEAINCFFNCGGADGAFTIVAGDSLTDLDIALEPGGRFSGTVTRASDGAALESARVQPIPAEFAWVRFSPQFHGLSDESGQYESPLAIAPGDYHLTAQPGPGENYVVHAWQDYSCQFERCPISDTDTVEIMPAAISGELDFALPAGATLSGTLTPDDIGRVVRLWDGSGFMLSDFFFLPWDPPGEDSWQFTGLAGGSYYVELGPLSSVEPWLRVLHNGLLCPFSGCERATGDPLVIPPGASLTLPEVSLQPGGQIEGKLVDANTGDAPSVVGATFLRTYDIVSEDGTVVGGGGINVIDGEVLLAPSAALPDGEYYVRTFNAFLGDGIGFQRLAGDTSTGYLPGYIDGMYPDVVCAGVKCDLSEAQPVSVVSGEITAITIELSTGGSLEGSVIDDDTGEPIPGAIARVLSADNEILASAITDGDGQFRIGAFPDGAYYLRTSMSGSTGFGDFGVQLRYFDHLHGSDTQCSERLCDPADGTAIVIDGSDVGPFELRVEPGPVISGRIIAQPIGLQLSNGRVEVFDSSGAFVGSYRINPNTGQYQTTALPPGDYTLVPVVSPAYSAVTTGDFNPRMMPGPLSSVGFVITIGTEDVSADIPVIDTGADRIFRNRFESE